MSADIAAQPRAKQESADRRVVVNPRFARKIRKHNFDCADDFLNLPGEVVSGHRDRHVVVTRIGRMKCFLKKEHRVSWSTRLHNWRQGFGWTSLSQREAQTLDNLREAGVPVPECIAYGSTDDGRSFLLLRTVSRAIPLQQALDEGNFTSFERWQLARNLGSAIARIHLAGFDAPDLSMKHVLVRVQDRSVVLLDWPRARRMKQMDRNLCLHALARLHASVPVHVASPRERLLVVQAFLHALGFSTPATPIAREIAMIAESMDSRRSIAEQPVSRTLSSQRLRWINGEQLCVTRPSWRAWDGVIPEWLRAASEKRSPWRTVDAVHLGTLGQGFLIQLPRASRWRRWWSWLRCRPAPCHAVTDTGLAFRMQRMGLPVCSILAFGARYDGSGLMLVRSPKQHRRLREWLALPRPGRNRIIVRLGRMLKRVHDAGCRQLTNDSIVVLESNGKPRLRIMPDGRWTKCRQMSLPQQVHELCGLASELRLFQRRDLIRLIRGYTHGHELKPKDLKLAKSVLQPVRRAA